METHINILSIVVSAKTAINLSKAETLSFAGELCREHRAWSEVNQLQSSAGKQLGFEPPLRFRNNEFLGNSAVVKINKTRADQLAA